MAGWLDLGTKTLLRAMDLQIAIYNEAGFFPWLKNTVAVADVAQSTTGPIVRYVAVSNPRMLPIIRKLLEPGEVLVEAGVRAHAERQLIDATGAFPIKYSIGAGRAICWDCAQEIIDAGFKACGPNGNPWFK